MSNAPPRKPDLECRDWPPRRSPLGIAAICFGIGNLLGPPIMVSALDGPENDGAFFLLPIGLGILLSQFGVVPAWLVWGERAFWQRLTIHWALVMGLSLAWSVGLLMAISVDRHGPPPTDVFIVLVTLCLCLPAVSLGIETPMWVTRHLFGWRLCRPAAAGEPPRPLAIRDFLWGMAVISCGLAAIRAAAAISYAPVSGEVWIGVAIAVGFAALASLLVMLPLTWCILRFKELGTGIVVIVAYTLAAGLTFLAIVGAAGGNMGSDSRPVIGVFLFLGSLAVTVASVLGLARGAGYHLEIGRRVDESSTK
jgi:hypothetical protein